MSGSKSLGLASRAGVACSGLALAALLIGCGSDGSSTVIAPQPLPELEGKLAGVVQAPNGEYASLAPTAPSLWDTLSFASTAYAWFLVNAEPVGIGILVSLSEVEPSDAADGEIENPFPIVQNANTNAGGVYEIIDDAIDRIESCRLMVSVGNSHNGDLSRAFVYAENTDVDPVSEATVRVILDRLTQAPPVQLCDFTRDGLRHVTEAVQKRAANAVGSNVEEINADAYARAKHDCRVLDAIDQATGTEAIGIRDCN